MRRTIFALFCALQLFAATGRTRKDPGSIEDFSIDYSSAASSNAITTSRWTIPSGLSRVTDSNTSTRTLVRLSGGTPGTSYRVVNTVTLTDGQVLVGTIVVDIEKD